MFCKMWITTSQQLSFQDSFSQNKSRISKISTKCSGDSQVFPLNALKITNCNSAQFSSTERTFWVLCVFRGSILHHPARDVDVVLMPWTSWAGRLAGTCSKTHQPIRGLQLCSCLIQSVVSWLVVINSWVSINTFITTTLNTRCNIEVGKPRPRGHLWPFKLFIPALLGGPGWFWLVLGGSRRF